MAHEELLEYLSALTASSVYNVHRARNARFISPYDLMVRHRARQGPKVHAAQAPAVRYALPGERYPSARPPGTKDNIIERLDAFAKRVKRG